MSVACPLVERLEFFASVCHYLMRMVKQLFGYECKLWPIYNAPFFLAFIPANTGQKVRDFNLAVDNLAHINFVRKNTANCLLRPVVSELCLDIFTVQYLPYLIGAVALFRVHTEYAADDPGFFLVDIKVENVARSFVITVNKIWDSALFGIDFFTELNTL